MNFKDATKRFARECAGKSQLNQNEYSLQIYQRESDRYVLDTLWGLVIFQFPIGFLLSWMKVFYATPGTFIMNAGFLVAANLIFEYMIKRNIAVKKMKYYLLSFIICCAGEMIFVYYNDIAMQMIWLFPVIMAALYFEKRLIVFTILGSLLGLLALNTITPITYRPERFSDLKATSLIVIIGLIGAVYFQFNRIRQLKYSMDNTMNAVTTGTAIINHAIKNEMVKISICTVNIERELAGGNEDLKVLQDSAQYLMSLVDKIQGKIQRISLEKSEVDVSGIIEECLESFNPYFKKNHIQIVRSYLPRMILRCDPLHIREVFNNLIKNALEAMKENDTLEINSKMIGKQWVINVIDTGQGISKENLSRVVDPFFSTKKNRSNNYGLGLTYCYNVIREHNGNLDIQSELNKGTMVTLSFPI
jgi:signal transduction histidine kinase